VLYNIITMSELFKTMLGFMAAPLLIIVSLVVMKVTFTMMGVDIAPVVSLMVAMSPIWMPIFLFWLFYEKWMEFVHVKFEEGQGRTTLRIKLPAEVFKSPEAMEQVLAHVHAGQSPDNLFQTYLDGKHPLIMSLELVSIGGDVRFYVNCPTKKVKDSLESQLYAQFPGIEVVEEEIDYTAEITPDFDKYDFFSMHMKQKGKEVYPIKTYIDFGMDKLPKEEFKIDPIASMIETLGTVKPHERLWIQLLCIPHVEKSFANGHIHGHGTWEHSIMEEIDSMMGRDHHKKGPIELEGQPRLTAGERSLIEAMERHMSKYAYEVGIRWFYTTKKGAFNANLVTAVIRSFSQFDWIGRNKIGVAWRTDFNYNMFTDRSGAKKNKLKKKELMNYKKRAPLHGSAINPGMKFQIMSVEELATMFHIPSSTVMTPGLGRIPSTRREAPSNLPIGNLPT